MAPPSEREIFFEALKMKGSRERAAYLDESCGRETALRNRLELLLAATADDGFLEKPLVDLAVGPGSMAEGPGGILGGYHLLEKIGEGGMGVVYLAEQRVPLRRRVALKVIKWGMDTSAVLARFEVERQALALMDHPNIARVLEGGATETGRPYFAMEWVQGDTITTFCAKRRLPVTERLRLFLGVCRAVQHAHQKGIIHRDLKPSNVLVTLQDGVPVPKVIDFGVAKAISQRLSEETLFTRFGTMIGTPAYMSPEQAASGGEDVDTRADIYGLGVLLYELLTGTQPFPEDRFRGVGLLEMHRILVEEEPERPSVRLRRATTAARTGLPSLAATGGNSPDLDAIVMKCLEKDRNRRYETANGLAVDVQRHLDGEPVSAHPPSALYRFGKWIGRHRVVATAAAFVLLSLVLGVTVSTGALLRERASRLREQAALRQSDQRLKAALGFVDRVVTNVAPEIRFTPGAAGAQMALLQAGLDFAEQLREGAKDDPQARLALARLLLYAAERQNPGEPNTVGGFASGLERSREALELLEAGIPQLSASEHLRLIWQGRFARIQCLSGLGQWEESLRRSHELDALLDQMERIPELAREARRHRMMIRSDRGWMLIQSGRPEDALNQELLPLLGGEWAKGITDESAADELLVLMIAHDNAANACFFTSRFDAMIRHTAEALRIAEFQGRRMPSNAFFLYVTAQCRAWHGLALLRNGRAEAGWAALRMARDEIEARTDKDAVSEAFRRHRAIIAAIQALACAGEAADPTASAAERRDRMARAEMFLAESQGFMGADAIQSATLRTARVEVPAARARLEADLGASP